MPIFKPLRIRRKTLLIILTVCTGIIVFAWASLQSAGKNRLIHKIEIKISPDSGVYFLTSQDVSNLLTETVGNPAGKSLSQLDIGRIEGKLKKMPQVEKAQVYVSLNGTLSIQLLQRKPVLRVINLYGEDYYLDSNGIKIPAMGSKSPDVLIANGMIREKLGDSSKVHSPVLRHLLKTAVFITADPYWNAMFEQCHVDNSGDILLLPRLGRHSIVTGTSENLDLKMRNLRVFYEKALPAAGWDTYSIINLKYKDQVVGVRRGSKTEHITTTNVQNSTH